MSTLNKLLPASAQARVQAFAASRRTRRWGFGILVFLLVFGLIGFFAVPPLLHHKAEQQLGQLLARPVSIGTLSLNPYTLRLEADQVHIGEHEGPGPFVDVGKLVVRVSWASLFRLKPVVGELFLDTPQVHIVRTDAQTFNFSDLVEQFSKPSPTPKTESKPLLFAVHNIHIRNGLIDFDDRLLKQHHVIDQLQLGIPFIANLPSKVDTFVQPLLQARIDGSPLQVAARTKPFNNALTSDVAIKLDQLDLPQLTSYAPTKLPVQLPKGKLSTDLDIQFAKNGDQPSVQISGSLDLADLSITDNAAQPLFDVAALHVAATGMEPLRGIIHLGEVRIDHPVLSVTRDRQGLLNLNKLTAQPAAEKPPATPPPAGAPAQKAPLDFSLQHLALNDGVVHLRDQSTAPAADLGIQQLNVALNQVSTLAHRPAQYEVKLALDHGGSLSSKGSFTLADSKAAVEAAIDHLALPQLQPYLAQTLSARLDRGTFGFNTSLTADWSSQPAKVDAGPAVVSLDGVRVLPEKQSKPLAELGHAEAHIEHFDLAGRRVELSNVALDGLVLNPERGSDGGINFSQLVRSQPPARAAAKRPAAKAAATVKEAPWTYGIGAVELNKAAINYADRSQPQPIAVSVAPLQIKLQHISSDLSKPVELELAGTFKRKGQLNLRGTVAPQPLKAALQIDGRQMDVAVLEPYFASSLNASIASALLSIKGDLKVAGDKQAFKAFYKGGASLSHVRMLDKLTSDLFLGWRDLDLSQIKAAYGERGTDVQVGLITLSDFYGRVLLNSNGKLNLNDILATENAPSTSLTRAGAEAPEAEKKAEAAPPPAAPAPAASASATPSPPLNLGFDHIVLHKGKVDYTDNFIKPNFSAHLVEIEGDIGAIGTQVTAPARVAIQAKLNENGPVAINGTANPLAKPPFLDMTATSRDVELTNFSAYSIKYTGYPIIKGKLNVDVHYLLDKNQLNANNHIFIDQFTFGDHVDSPTATNLPVRLAISLLKNSRGEIDVNVPVSGSLDDPQISVGSLIWHAFLNVLEKAVTSPFSLLANAFGGGGEELGYVAFQPGLATLSGSETKKLDTIAKALADRPAIKLNVAGRVDPALDTPGLKQAELDRQVKRQKLKEMIGKGESVDPDSVQVSPEEYNKYLERAYSAASIKKPRNFIGIAKTLPADEMKKLMLDSITVTEADLNALAQRRATLVQTWFQGKVDPSRIFILAPKLDASGIKDNGPSTRAEFTLE